MYRNSILSLYKNDKSGFFFALIHMNMNEYMHKCMGGSSVK